MSETAAIEERLAVLESEIAQLKRQVMLTRTWDTWLDRVTGSLEDTPEFDEVLRLGREIRKSDAPDGET